MQKLRLWSYGLVVASAVTVLPVYADHVDPANIQPGQLVLIVENGTATWDTLFENVNTLTNYDISNGTGWDWSLTGSIGGDADPIVTNNLTLTNSMNSVQTYTVTQLIGVNPAITPSSLTSGSIGGSVTDNNNNGATLATTNATALYSSLIDGSVFKTLLNDPFSATALAGSTQAFPLAGGNFGLPGPSFPGPEVNSTIGIQLSFTLTPGDSVSFTSNFQVVPVPVPAALLLFGSGLLSLVGVAKRKKA